MVPAFETFLLLFARLRVLVPLCVVVLGIELHMVDRASSRSVLGTGFPSSLRLTACYSFDGHNERVALKDQFNAQSAVSMWATIHSVGLRESGAVVLVSIQRLDYSG